MILFEKPKPEDGICLHHLISLCPPLDLNSKYLYYLIAHHFAGTSVILRDPQDNNKAVGLTTAYVLPDKSDVLFVWQVALLHEYRGRGLASQMLDHLLSREKLNGIKHIYSTISPNNRASINLFKAQAKKRNALIQHETFLNEKDFYLHENNSGAVLKHDKEILYKIGPFKAGRQNQLNDRSLI